MAMPAIYDLTATFEDAGPVTVAWPIHAANFVALLIVQSANEVVTLSDPQGFVLVAEIGVGTAGAAGATRLTIFACRATSGAMPSPTIADAGDHVTGRMLTFQNAATVGQFWRVLDSSTVDPAAAPVSIGGGEAVNGNSLMIAVSAGAIDDVGFVGSSSWANPDMDGGSASFFAWAQTDVGVGGGWFGGVGELATPAVVGPFTSNWNGGATRQANILLLLSDEEQVTVTESPAIGDADGTSSASGLATTKAIATGTAAGTGSAAGLAVTIVHATGTSSGVGAASGAAVTMIGALGTAAGVGSAAGLAVTRSLVTGAAAGLGEALGRTADPVEWATRARGSLVESTTRGALVKRRTIGTLVRTS